jgi:hypothetical protein
LQSRAVQALLQAEQRNLLAEKIGGEIRARPDFVSGNRVVTTFLTGPWAQVMARERLLGEHETGGGKAQHSLTLGEVLWSLDPRQTAGRRKRLVNIIPGMLENLRAGLLSVDYPLAHSKVFFDELMQIHQAALKAEPPGLDERARNLRSLDAAFGERDAASSKRPWLAPTEARNSGFMEDFGVDTKPALDETQLPDTESGDVAAETTPSSGSVELKLGAWVELFSEEKWLRAQLTWISPYNTLFMFTSEGGRTHSMTGPLLQYLLLQELVKVISTQGVLEGALNNVARTAMRNSVDGNSQ